MRSLLAFIAIVVIFAIFSSAASAQEVKWQLEEDSIVKYEKLMELSRDEFDALMKQLGINPLTDKQITTAASGGVGVEPIDELVSFFPPTIEHREVILSLDESGKWSQKLKATSHEQSPLAWMILGLTGLFVAATATSNIRFWLPTGSLGFAIGVTIGIISEGSPFGIFLGITIGFLFGMIPVHDGDFHPASMPTLIGAVATTFLLSGDTGVTTQMNIWNFGWLCVLFAGFEAGVGLFVQKRRAERQELT